MNDIKPFGTEFKAKVARAYGSRVIGCKKHDAAVLLSFIDENAKFNDVFMDREPAEQIYQELGKRLAELKERTI